MAVEIRWTGDAGNGNGRAVVTARARRLFVCAFIVMLLASACGRPGNPTPSASQTASTGRATVTFASEPDPPASGDNRFIVTVKRPDGTPVEGGSVKAVFSMPAMPSMNMPAMRSETALSPEGGGVYRGTGQLSMGGTWNVEVSVSSGSEDLGRARFSVVAK